MNAQIVHQKFQGLVLQLTHLSIHQLLSPLLRTIPPKALQQLYRYSQWRDPLQSRSLFFTKLFINPQLLPLVFLITRSCNRTWWEPRRKESSNEANTLREEVLALGSSLTEWGECPLLMILNYNINLRVRMWLTQPPQLQLEEVDRNRILLSTRKQLPVGAVIPTPL